ncbi:MAG TPA: [acyl-carrier-protein] S-malonyltransferase [Gammaproteobacteria bacterium]|nr:[acyl-carrier-protein] S-malonyltransferase [Gammaproteobacteria bacterium]
MSVAFVFPGQGSQSVGMMTALADEAVVRDVFTEAGEALGQDLWQIVQEGPEETLNSTEITQPAMLAAGVALWRLWQSRGGPVPAFMAGHSLGEYSALVAAGSLAFADAVKLVHRRGRFMQEAVPAGSGAMAAILGLDDEAVADVCTAAAEGAVVEPVNFNAPGQVVVAGERAAVERATVLAKEQGAKRALMLPVSVPSHCSLMKPAAEQLAGDLAAVGIDAPSVPVICNVDVTPVADAEAIRDALVRQLYRPVRWVEIIRYLAAQGVDQLVECGPGKVLTGLNKRIERAMTARAVFDPSSLEQALAELGA